MGVVKEDLRCDDIYDNCGYIYIYYICKYVNILNYILKSTNIL